MGIHKYSPSRNARTPRAHLDRNKNGDIYGVLKCGFRKDSPCFRYCFIGKETNTLTYKDVLIQKHPKFKNISQFESWCNRYMAETDITDNI